MAMHMPKVSTRTKRTSGSTTRAFDGAKSQDGSFEHSYAKLQPWSKGNRELLEEGEGSLSTSTTATAGQTYCFGLCALEVVQAW